MPISKEIHDLLKKCSSLADNYNCHQIYGGGNNRIYLVEDDNRKLIVKKYFQHENDTRNRLKNEYLFLEYAKQVSIQCVPFPIENDYQNNIAVYSFIKGKQPSISDITRNYIKMVCDFYSALNKDKHHGIHLLSASEACYRYKDYIDIIEKRIACFTDFHEESALDKDVINFLKNNYMNVWLKIKKNFLKQVNIHENFKESGELCITPSDFGFHNVLIDGDNLKFIDFEYSGWDDPAKTICDFFLQPKVPVSTEFFGLVSTSFAESSKYPEKCLTRVKNVMPLCQAKWVLILLNGFSKVGRTRRNFSSAHHISALENQLIKAKELLNKIEV